MQSQLARLTGKGIQRSAFPTARERNPRQRMALREELAKFNKDVAQGKIPIPRKRYATQTGGEPNSQGADPKKLKDLEKQFDRVAKIEMPHTSEVLSQKQINSLKQNLTKYPNAQKRGDLEKQVTQLQRSVEARTTAEQHIQKIDTISAEASRQEDPRKRNGVARPAQSSISTGRSGSRACSRVEPVRTTSAFGDPTVPGTGQTEESNSGKEP